MLLLIHTTPPLPVTTLFYLPRPDTPYLFTSVCPVCRFALEWSLQSVYLYHTQNNCCPMSKMLIFPREVHSIRSISPRLLLIGHWAMFNRCIPLNFTDHHWCCTSLVRIYSAHAQTMRLGGAMTDATPTIPGVVSSLFQCFWVSRRSGPSTIVDPKGWKGYGAIKV